MEFKHIPVLLNEVIEGLNINPSGFYLDCTLGGAGHSSEIVKKLNHNGLLIAFDKDIEAIKISAERLSKIAKVIIYDESSPFEIKKDKELPTCILIKDDFKNSPEFIKKVDIKLDGILIDLGVSSYQIDNAKRGFSFRSDAPLDMRMDQSQSLTAKDIVNSYSEQDLLNLFYKYGEEEFSKSIAKNIIKERVLHPIETTTQLNEIIENSMPKKVVFSRGGASKKVFQALRIEVNSELLGLDTLLKDLTFLLKPLGRFCVISFHSLEDRIVKTVFKDLALDCICPPSFPRCVCGHKADIKIISKKPIIAQQAELNLNSRSACAKLRIVEKT